MGKPLRSSARKAHFFKVLLGDFSERLRIPPNFMKHISKEASKRAILQGPSGSSWHVQLGETIKGTFLSSGWSNFVKDHSLREHEFLVFRYEGNMHFSVQIFDTTACEREDMFGANISKKSMLCEARNELGGPVKHPLAVDTILQHEVSKRTHMPSPKADGLVKVETEDVDLPICIIEAPTKLTKGYLSRRRPVTTQERLKAREAADSFSSSFPYLIRSMNATSVYRTYTVRFPNYFSRPNFPRKRTPLVLRDPSGKAWVVDFVPGSRDRISAGWSAFARGNNLEEGDFCVFELVGPVELRVHIFRVVEEALPLIKR